MKRTRWTLAALALVGALSLPLPAGAQGRCADPMTRLEQMELVVHARIVAVPTPGTAELQVERYHRGMGPAKLMVEFQGGGSLDALEPVTGADMLIELTQDEPGYSVGACALFKPYAPALTEVQLALEVMGPGSPPQADPPPTTPTPAPPPPQTTPTPPSTPGNDPTPWGRIALIVAAMAALGGAVGWYMSRRRAQE